MYFDFGHYSFFPSLCQTPQVSGMTLLCIWWSQHREVNDLTVMEGV